MAHSVKTRDYAPQIATSVKGGAPWRTQVLPASSESIDSFTHNLTFLGKFDVGGPMLLQRVNYQRVLPRIYLGGQHVGSDVVFGQSLASPYGHPAVPSDISQWGTGATAISRSIPTAPEFQAVTAFREFRSDGVPSVPAFSFWKKRVQLARQSGDEYLNVQFGWLPLISDMRSFARSVNKSEAILNAYHAGSDMDTRVGYHFPTTDETATFTDNPLCYLAGDNTYSGRLSVNSFARQTKKTWFSGTFTYHLPASDAQMSRLGRHILDAQKLLGVVPTPENIWNSSPWTWGADWFANIGDVMTNVSNLGPNGSALRWGYLMSSVRTELKISSPQQQLKSGVWVSSGSQTRVNEWKKRIAAHPFGFGVTDLDLSSTQRAVIAALGLTRFPRR